MRVFTRLAVVVALVLAGGAAGAVEQGVGLRFEQPGGGADGRAARLVALYVPEGTAPTPFLAPGAFTATFSGFVNLRLRGEYTFSVLGRGTVVVKVGGAVVLEAEGEDFAGKASGVVKLVKGKNPIEVVYTAPATGDAAVRLLWASREFPAEPVQPGVLSYDPEPLAEATTLREGRELVGTLRCAKCHELPGMGEGGMPELASDGPDLTNAGARLKREWMAAWIADPRGMRPDASMPKVAGAAEAAGDLAAYLASLGRPAAAAGQGGAAGEEAEGGQLFAALGCVGCHTLPGVEEADAEHGRVTLKYVNAKFQPGALKAWLMNPQEHYRWTRMPDFRLSELEADRLVAFLAGGAKGVVAEGAPGDVGKGKAAFETLGCGSCHAVSGGKQGVAGVKVAAWEKACSKADFGLSEGQVAAVAAFGRTGMGALGREAGREFAERSVRRLQCVACHARDEVEDRWSALAEEVAELMPPETNIESDQTEEAKKGPKIFHPRGLGELMGGDEIVVGGDQSRPGLTWAGEKLNADWMGAFIGGEVKYKPRYWLRARMPAFAVHAKGMAEGLAWSHGVSAKRQAAGAVKEELGDLGQKLISRDGGFACVTCHSVGESKAASPFEAPGLNFAHVSERLTHDYFVRWMRKPMRFAPGTKMPQYSEDGKSTLTDVLGGDADQQFEAVWEFLRRGEKVVGPE